MSTTVDGLRLRKVMGRTLWSVPLPFGPDGWSMTAPIAGGSIIVTTAPHGLVEWTHASIAYADRLPDYDDLIDLKRAVWGDDGYAYQVFAPADQHVNIHNHALHLYGQADGRPALPEFAGILNGRLSI